MAIHQVVLAGKQLSGTIPRASLVTIIYSKKQVDPNPRKGLGY
jgi:hypothetical protein